MSTPEQPDRNEARSESEGAASAGEPSSGGPVPDVQLHVGPDGSLGDKARSQNSQSRLLLIWVAVVGVPLVLKLAFDVFTAVPAPRPNLEPNQALPRTIEPAPVQTNPVKPRVSAQEASSRMPGDRSFLKAPFSKADGLAAREAWAKHLGKPETLKNSLGMEFVLIPPGEFTMGSSESVEELAKSFPGPRPEDFEEEMPAHRVRITRPMYFGKYEVTKSQFEGFVQATGYKTESERNGEGAVGWVESELVLGGLDPKYSWRETGFAQSDFHPVANISWNDAQEFAKWLTSQDSLGEFRLPTEAEWEYACRAGTTWKWSHGDSEEQLARFANLGDQSAAKKLKKHMHWPPLNASDGSIFSAKVGSYEANPFGLFDMHGNVWEWCQDIDAKYEGSKNVVDDPVVTTGKELRIQRGGSWLMSHRFSRSASRDAGPQSSSNNTTGFRVVIGLKSP